MRLVRMASYLGVALTLWTPPAKACPYTRQINIFDAARADLVVIGRIMSGVDDYPRFTLMVDEVLAGQAGDTLIARWNTRVSDDRRRLQPGQYLIALNRSVVRGADGALPLPIVLEEPCAQAFVVESTSNLVPMVRHLLGN